MVDKGVSFSEDIKATQRSTRWLIVQLLRYQLVYSLGFSLAYLQLPPKSS